MVDLAQRLAAMGFKLMATEGTAQAVGSGRHSSASTVKKLQEGQPNLLDYLIDGDMQLIMNTPSGKGARTDEGRIRAAAVATRRALHHDDSSRRRRRAGDGSADQGRDDRAGAARSTELDGQRHAAPTSWREAILNAKFGVNR